MGSRGSGCGRIAEGSRTWAYSFTGVSGQDQIVFSLADITEMANLAATKRDFAVNVAHELRTPLTAIKGFAETLAERAEGEDAKFVETILRNTERLISLVRDVQTLAQLENPVSEPEVRPVDLNSLIATILELFRPAASKKGLDLLFEPAEVAPVAGDSFRLEQVLVNLLDNAVKYTDKGAVKICPRGGGNGRRRDLGYRPGHSGWRSRVSASDSMSWTSRDPGVWAARAWAWPLSSTS